MKRILICMVLLLALLAATAIAEPAEVAAPYMAQVGTYYSQAVTLFANPIMIPATVTAMIFDCRNGSEAIEGGALDIATLYPVDTCSICLAAEDTVVAYLPLEGGQTMVITYVWNSDVIGYEFTEEAVDPASGSLYCVEVAAEEIVSSIELCLK